MAPPLRHPPVRRLLTGIATQRRQIAAQVAALAQNGHMPGITPLPLYFLFRSGRSEHR